MLDYWIGCVDDNYSLVLGRLPTTTKNAFERVILLERLTSSFGKRLKFQIGISGTLRRTSTLCLLMLCAAGELSPRILLVCNFERLTSLGIC